MSKSKFTPGPWKFCDGDSPGIDSVAQGEREFTIVVFGQIGVDHEEVGVQGRSKEESVANAKLMADAPAMLEELRTLYDLAVGFSHDKEFIDMKSNASELLNRHGG